MSSERIQGLERPAERLAAARSESYRLLARAFTFPDAGQLGAIGSGVLAAAMREALESVDASLLESADWRALADAGAEDELAVEYTRLFEVGVSGPPCPLYGGLYGGARMKTMEEAVRFYNHFGLTLAEKPRELPDHLVTQLEFLHYLTFRETEALQQRRDAGPFRRAERDFLARHPGRWVPALRRRLDGERPPPFFRELTRLLERFLEHDHGWLVAQVGPLPAVASTPA